MFEAYFVYTLLLLMLVYCSYLTNVNRKREYIYTGIVIASLVLGLRYNVGSDFMSYKSVFVRQSYDSFPNIEIGYRFVNELLYECGFSFSSIFIFIAFFQLFFFYKAVKVMDKAVPYVFFFYFTTLYIFFSLNGIRQALAFSMLVFSIEFIYKRELAKYCFILIIASLFHKSVLMFVPFYFFINRDYLKSVKLQYFLYFVFFFIGPTIREFLWNNLSIMSSILGYDDYSMNIEALKEINWESGGSGLGNVLWFCIDSWVILNSNKLKKYNGNVPILIFYNLYFIGILLNFCTQGTYLSRVNIYFLNMRIIIYALMCVKVFYIEKKMHNKLIGTIFMFVLLAFFYMAISNSAGLCSPYQFVFE